jgi:hypothetical protein
MADRYWVGGAGSWNSTTKWSTTSGGASGASVPTSADNAIFDASSGSGAVHYIVTVSDSSTCANLTFTPVAANGVTEFSLGTGFVIAGTFSTSGTAGNRRAWFRSSTYGLTRDMQIATIGTVTDVDFRDVRVTGAGGTLSGTRIGDLRGCSGITFSTAKIVYWNLAGAQNWSANGWATTSAGTPSTDNFPLAQDTATFTNAGSVTGTITMDTAIPYTGTVDMSGRTSAMTLSITTLFNIYGNWTNGSGTTISGLALTYSGRNTQTIISAGKAFPGDITVDSYGGSVELASALNIGVNSIFFTNGTFDTKNYNVTAGIFSSTNSNVRTIKLGSSTVTLSGTGSGTTTTTNLTFDAGTSSIVLTADSTGTILDGGSLTFYDVSLTGTNATNTPTIAGNNTYRNLSFTAPTSTGIPRCSFSGNATITGTLTCAGASAVRRIMLQSSVIGTPRTLTVATLSANDCDFRDITIAGAAAGGSPTRAGNCGGNTGITFPGAKTVYWNLAGAANWSDTAWATSSGGTPAVNNFPLAQDTAVFDNTGSVTGTITIDALWNIGTFNASARTSAMTLTTSTNTPTVYGNWLFGTGVTSTSATGTITFGGRGTQTITSNGVTFGCSVAINSSIGTAQLADALVLNSARTLSLTSGTFDAVSYNVTTGIFSTAGGTSPRLKMGSGTWTLTGTGTVWNGSALANTTAYFEKNTANIVLSDTSTTARTFAGGTQSFNKLTIGGATGISTFTITGDNQFTELASTKTVAHTIALGATASTFGAWTVTGTVGNVVTVSGTATLTIAGARVSGVDYLALGTTTISATSPGEFYAGANSTGGTNAILTAAPAATTRYWRGGSGTWDATTTTNWATTSGGAGPASVPTSADAVVFDSLSNATAYTVTCTATQLRCAALTMAGPATGNVTWAGTAPLAIHGNFSLPATVLTRTYTGAITFSGSATGKTITTNGNTLASTITVNGVGCGWTLADALNIGLNALTVTNGSFASSSYALTFSTINSSSNNTRTINFGSSTVTGTTAFGTTENARASLTFNAGTSQLNLTANSFTFDGNNQTFYNVSGTNTALTTVTFSGVNTFNNLTFIGRTSAGITNIVFSGNQTISGTLTLSAGTDATMRNFVQSSTIGTTRTLTCAAFAGTDADFRDITIAGAAAPVSGTRLGDCKGNSGITFGAGTTKYWNLNAGGNWSAIGWATSSGGSPAINNFPLAQDTCLFEATGLTSGNTVTVNASYNIGTINMAARTSNTMVLATSTNSPTIYGNWINGTGTTTSGNGTLTFAGRTSQTITNAAVTFSQLLSINTPSGSVTLQDAFSSSNANGGAISVTFGTFNANGFNVTLSGSTSGVNLQSTATVAVGSGTWTIAGTNFWAATASTTITGTGTISATSASAKAFVGGGISYSGITLNQGGAGALTITGNNTFANISNTYKATGATNITLGTTTQTVGSFTASGETTRVLTLQGSSSTSPGTLVYSGSGSATSATTDYLTLTGVRAYSLATTWYAGANSTNNGSLGWLFSAAAAAGGGGKFFLMFG